MFEVTVINVIKSQSPVKGRIAPDPDHSILIPVIHSDLATW